MDADAQVLHAMDIVAPGVVVTVSGPGGTARFADAGSDRLFETGDGFVLHVNGSIPGGGVKGHIVDDLDDLDDLDDDVVVVRGSDFGFERLCRRID